MNPQNPNFTTNPTPNPAPTPQGMPPMPPTQPNAPFQPQPSIASQTQTQPQFPSQTQPTYQQVPNYNAGPLASTPLQPPAPTPQVVENPISTQATLLFSELRDGIIIMKDGSFRAVVACQSINFDLMSDTEREGVEANYQDFLNSLNFTIQVLVRSQRIDLGPYIENLSKLRRENDNMLLGVLMDDYINFIDYLSQAANIMDKSFFIVIPYYSSADMEQAIQQTKNLFKTFSKNRTPAVTRINRDTYNKAIDELNNRVETVMSGLFNIGIQSVRLNTRELSELFYNFNNPDTAVREPLVDFTKLGTTYIQKGEK